MAKAIFTTKVNPTYDDLPEVRYHFPKTYLNQAQATVAIGLFITNHGGRVQMLRVEVVARYILQLRECNGLYLTRIDMPITMLL